MVTRASSRRCTVIDLTQDLTHQWTHDGRTTTFTWLETLGDIAPTRVYAIAVTDDARILLVGAGPSDSRWWLPGGGIEEAEDAESALRRELDEEAGATVDDLELLAYRQVEDPVDGRSVIATFWARVQMPPTFEPKFEVSESLLVHPDEFLDHLFWADDPAARRLLGLAMSVEAQRGGG